MRELTKAELKYVVGGNNDLNPSQIQSEVARSNPYYGTFKDTEPKPSWNTSKAIPSGGGSYGGRISPQLNVPISQNTTVGAGPAITYRRSQGVQVDGLAIQGKVTF